MCKYSGDRNNDPKYKTWSWTVKALCGFECMLCNKKGGELESHHIIRWADNVKLRYLVANGVCLCKPCHKLVTGREDKYTDYFKKIMREKLAERKRNNAKFHKSKQKKSSKLNTKIKKRRKQNVKMGYTKPKRRLKSPRARY